MNKDVLKALTPFYISTLGALLVIIAVFFASAETANGITNLGYACITGAVALAEPIKEQKEKQ